MVYTANKPQLAPSSDELRNTIEGWGVDLNSNHRPAVTKENFNPAATGAHWNFPERQIETYPREKSPEHKFLTPVFGTACPPRGLSGRIRRYAYTLSEGRTAHWVLLVLADRLDVFESGFRELLRGRPDNPITETGIVAEFKHHGLRSRLGQRRADTKHLPVDVLMFAGKGLLLAGGIYALSRLVRPKRRFQIFA